MATYLTTKRKFQALNEFEKRDVQYVLDNFVHKSHVYVQIELRNPPKGIDMSRVYGSLGICDYNMKEYIRMNSKIVKQSVSVEQIKSWLNEETL
jgi:GTP cyclohydrolase FolE2